LTPFFFYRPIRNRLLSGWLFPNLYHCPHFSRHANLTRNAAIIGGNEMSRLEAGVTAALYGVAIIGGKLE